MISKKLTTIILVALVAITLTTALAQVETGRGGGNGGGNKGGGKGDGSGPNYFDPATVVSLNGTLTEVRSDWVAQGNGNFTGTGLHFVFSSGGTSYELILAPAQFLSDLGISLGVGDSVSVTGSVVDAYVSGYSDEFIIASSITVGGVMGELRDSAGFPLWRGAGNGGANGQGIGQGPQNENYYDPSTVTTLNGTLVETLDYWTARGNGNSTGSGMHYVFEANNGTRYYLMAGPYWFLDDNGAALDLEDELTVTGSVVSAYDDSLNSYDYLIANTLSIDGATVELRDAEGYPLWRSGANGDYNCPNYDSNATGTISGTIAKVRYRSNGSDADTGMELIIRANGKRYRAYVAPLYYCENQDINLQKGDSIRIRGSIDKRKVVTRNITTSNGQRLNLRRANGSPLWQN